MYINKQFDPGNSNKGGNTVKNASNGSSAGAAATSNGESNSPTLDQAASKVLDDAKLEAQRLLSEANTAADKIKSDTENAIADQINSAKQEAQNIIDEALTEAKRIVGDAQAEADRIKEQITNQSAPNQSAISFAPSTPTVASNPTYVTRNIDGIDKKFLIRGKHFSINDKEYTDADLARDENAAIIDGWIANGSGILQEVFEEVAE